MKPVAVSQRVEFVEARDGKRRDALDQRWGELLASCGYLACPMTNDPQIALAQFRAMNCRGLVLTGGNDLFDYGGNAPERDETESLLIELCQQRGLPVFAVCRGMQLLLVRAGHALERVEGHVSANMDICVDGRDQRLNSYHDWGCRVENPRPYDVFARTDDGVLKAIRDPVSAITAIMWHPERLSEVDADTRALIVRALTVSAA